MHQCKPVRTGRNQCSQYKPVLPVLPVHTSTDQCSQYKPVLPVLLVQTSAPNTATQRPQWEPVPNQCSQFHPVPPSANQCLTLLPSVPSGNQYKPVFPVPLTATSVPIASQYKPVLPVPHTAIPSVPSSTHCKAVPPTILNTNQCFQYPPVPPSVPVQTSAPSATQCPQFPPQPLTSARPLLPGGSGGAQPTLMAPLGNGWGWGQRVAPGNEGGGAHNPRAPRSHPALRECGGAPLNLPPLPPPPKYITHMGAYWGGGHRRWVTAPLHTRPPHNPHGDLWGEGDIPQPPRREK